MPSLPDYIEFTRRTYTEYQRQYHKDLTRRRRHRYRCNKRRHTIPPTLTGDSNSTFNEPLQTQPQSTLSYKQEQRNKRRLLRQQNNSPPDEQFAPDIAILNSTDLPTTASPDEPVIPPTSSPTMDATFPTTLEVTSIHSDITNVAAQESITIASSDSNIAITLAYTATTASCLGEPHTTRMGKQDITLTNPPNQTPTTWVDHISTSRRSPYIHTVTDLTRYREVRYHRQLNEYVYTPISSYTIGSFKTNISRTAAVKREQAAWDIFNEAETLSPHAQPPNMYELPIVVDIHGNGPRVKVLRRNSIKVLQNMAERQRYEYLTRVHAPKKIKQSLTHMYVATSQGLRRVDISQLAPPTDSSSESLSDSSMTQQPNPTFTINTSFNDGYQYVFKRHLLHTHWSSTIKCWDSNLMTLTEHISKIINNHIVSKGFEYYHPLRHQPEYLQNLRYWLHLQLWKDPFFLRDITDSQKSIILEDTDFNPMYPERHWMRTDLLEHTLRIIQPKSYIDPEDEDMTLIHVRRYQEQQVNNGYTLDIRLLQILNYIDKYHGNEGYRHTPALQQFVQLQHLLHNYHPTLSTRYSAIKTLQWLLEYAQQGYAISKVITHQDNTLSTDIIRWVHTKYSPRIQPSVNMMRTQSYQCSGHTPKDSDPIFDSGCSHHMWNHTAHFTSYIPNDNMEFRASAAFGASAIIYGRGNIGPIHDVLYIPDLTHCLISSYALAQQGYEMRTGTNSGLEALIVKRSNPSEVLLRGVAVNNLYRITRKEFERQLHLTPTTCLAHMVTTQPLLHLHQLLGHASAERCAYECQCHQFPGLQKMSTRSFQAIRECEECALAKSHRQPSPGHLDTPEFIGQTWYVDVKGPVATPSIVNGNTYVFGIIEAKTKFLIQYFMKQKSEVLHYFQLFHDQFIPYVRALNPRMLAITIYSDMGEFHSQAVRDYCHSKGIHNMTTCAYSPQQNGIIERAWRSITEAAIAILLTANLPENYWEEARSTAGYIRNRITGGKPYTDPTSPYEKFFGRKPHIRHFKVFGVYAYVHIPVKNKDHSAKAQQGIFVGYVDETIGGYKVFLPKTNEFVVSKHVTFGKSPNRTNLIIEGAPTDTTLLPDQLTLKKLQAFNLSRALQNPPPVQLSSDSTPLLDPISLPPTEDLLSSDRSNPPDPENSPNHTTPESM